MGFLEKSEQLVRRHAVFREGLKLVGAGGWGRQSEEGREGVRMARRWSQTGVRMCAVLQSWASQTVTRQKIDTLTPVADLLEEEVFLRFGNFF